MINACEEFVGHTKDKNVLCVFIECRDCYSEEPKKQYVLKKGFTDDEFEQFLKTLDFEYDDGFGTQELYGTIWYTDGTYSDRREYDGSEWWEHQKMPEIPKVCTSWL